MKNKGKNNAQISIDSSIESVMTNIVNICLSGNMDRLIRISKEYGNDLDYGEAINYYITFHLDKYSFDDIIKYLTQIVADENYNGQLNTEDINRIITQTIKGKKLSSIQLYRLLTFDIFVDNAMLISDLLPANYDPRFRNLLFFIADGKISKLIELAYKNQFDRNDVIINYLLKIINTPESVYVSSEFDEFSRYYSEVNNSNKKKCLEVVSHFSSSALYEYIVFLIENSTLDAKTDLIKSGIDELEARYVAETQDNQPKRNESCLCLLKFLNNKVTDSITRHPELSDICKYLNSVYGYPIASYVKQQVNSDIVVQRGYPCATVSSIATELDIGLAQNVLHIYSRILNGSGKQNQFIRRNLYDVYMNTFRAYSLHLELEIYEKFLRKLLDPSTILDEKLFSEAADIDSDYNQKKIEMINGQYAGEIPGGYHL